MERIVERCSFDEKSGDLYVTWLPGIAIFTKAPLLSDEYAIPPLRVFDDRFDLQDRSFSLDPPLRTTSRLARRWGRKSASRKQVGL